MHVVIYDSLSSSGCPMITYTHPVANDLSIKTLVAKLLQMYIYNDIVHTHTCTHTHSLTHTHTHTHSRTHTHSHTHTLTHSHTHSPTHRLKSLLQVLAASQAGRDVVYFTFSDRGLQNDLCTIHRRLVQHKITVGQVRNGTTVIATV